MRFDKYMNEGAAQASATTRLQESLACVGFGMAQILGRNLERDDMDKPELFLQGYTKFCDVDASDSELWDFKYNNETWIQSVITSVNAMRDSKWLKGKYKFYRGKSLMNQIYEQFNKLKKKDNVKIANDKWNPGDIWASKKPTIPSFDNLIEFNKFISDSLKKGTLIGISLKKVGKSAKVVWQGPVDKPEIVGYKIVKSPKDMFPTGMVITTTKDKIGINFRSFRISKQADITGEIVMTGGTARHGKVPSTTKNKMISQYNIPQMPKSKIKKLVDTEGGIEDLKRMVTNLWKQCGYNFPPKKVESEWAKRAGNIQDAVGYWQSILHSLEMGAFLNTHKSVADEIINNFYVGATSTGGFSSEFIKIY
jgi:hypothetical protein